MGTKYINLHNKFNNRSWHLGIHVKLKSCIILISGWFSREGGGCIPMSSLLTKLYNVYKLTDKTIQFIQILIIGEVEHLQNYEKYLGKKSLIDAHNGHGA